MPPRRYRRLRRWALIVLALIVIAFLVPVLATPLVAARLSRVLGTNVDIDYITVQPVDAVVTLHGVVVHAPETAEASTEAPPIVADRVWLDLQWLPLMHQSLRLRELGLEQARIAVDRLPDGSFRLQDLMQPDPTHELPAGWTFALERIALLDGVLQVRDLASGDAKPFEVAVRDADVSGMQRRPTAFGKALNMHVDARIGRGRLRVDGRYELRDEGLSLDALVRVKNVPLQQAVSTFTDVRFAELSGRISGQLRWQREPKRRDQVTGLLTLRRGVVQMPDLEAPALEARRVEVDLEKIDLLRRKMAIASITLHGVALAVRPEAADPIPILADRWRAEEPPSKASTKADAARKAVAPWTWMIERVESPHARLRVLAPDGPIELHAQATGENLGPEAYWSPVRIEVTHGDATAKFDGTARLGERVAIEGRLSAGGIDAPAFARTVGLPGAELARAGHAAADLNVEIDTDKKSSEVLDLRGPIAITGLEVARPDEDPNASLEGVSGGAAGVELQLEGIVPGDGAVADARPTEIRIASARLTTPYARFTRKRPPPPADRIDPESLGSVSGPAMTPAPTPTPAPTETPSTQVETKPTAPPPVIVVRELGVHEGRLAIDDQATIPPVGWDVAPIFGMARDLRLPALTFASLELFGRDPRFGELKLTGVHAAGGNSLELLGSDVPLAATTPYLRLAGLPYAFDDGRGSISARVSFGEKRWSSDTTLTLRGQRYVGADALEKAIGMPVRNAESALQDLNGHVSLNLLLSSRDPESTYTYEDLVASGLRDAIQRAIAAPPQLPEGFNPLEVFFSPGRAELTTTGQSQLTALADLLEFRTGLYAVMGTFVSRQDQRWLAEQALAPELEGGGGLFGVLRAFGIKDAQDRIHEALMERAEGGPGYLDEEDQEVLDDLLLEAPPIGTDRLVTLGARRLARVQEYLSDRHGVPRERVVMGVSERRESFGPPAVRINVRVAAKFEASPASTPPVFERRTLPSERAWDQ